MKYTQKPFEELDVMDDFLMNAIATDSNVGVPFCRAVLSVLLQRKIGDLRVTVQRTIPPLAPGLRGIRMDVEVEELNKEGDQPVLNIYDLEPHLQKNINLPRHNRFYQARIDSRGMKSGENDFVKLPNLYVITILNFDPFGYDYMMYNIKNQCSEIPQLSYDDGLQFLYFYTGGSKGGNEEIRELLQYFQNSTERNVKNEIVEEVHNYVKQVKVLPEVKQEYMMFEDYLYYKKLAWKEEAKEEMKEEVKEEVREEVKEEVKQEIEAQLVLELLEDYGKIPEELQKRVTEEQDATVLKHWHKLAAKAESIEDFQRKMDGAVETISCTP